MFFILNIISIAIALRPRQFAPVFKGTAVMPDQTFKTLSSDDYKGKWLIMVFYPADFTYVCPTQLNSFSDSVQEFKKLNTQILGISTDSHFSHLAWIKTPKIDGGIENIKIPLLSDITKTISKQYEVLVQQDQQMAGQSLRGMFIIDPQGILRSSLINDAPVGRNVNETLRLVQAFQFADKNGVVCPANWQPGKATIIPDPQKKKEYFENDL